jgi:hypothetical protein
VALAVNYNVSRVRPGEITHAWAGVAFWNIGGRALSAEKVGIYFHAIVDDGHEQRNAAIPLDDPIDAPVDGPTRVVYTPLGPLLAAGLDLGAPTAGFVQTAGQRQWLSSLTPLVTDTPPGSTPEQLGAGLRRLRNEAETPPIHQGLVWLTQEDPYLPSEPPDWFARDPPRR